MPSSGWFWCLQQPCRSGSWSIQQDKNNININAETTNKQTSKDVVNKINYKTVVNQMAFHPPNMEHQIKHNSSWHDVSTYLRKGETLLSQLKVWQKMIKKIRGWSHCSNIPKLKTKHIKSVQNKSNQMPHRQIQIYQNPQWISEHSIGIRIGKGVGCQ